MLNLLKKNCQKFYHFFNKMKVSKTEIRSKKNFNDFNQHKKLVSIK